MKRHKLQHKFLEELEKIPNITYACGKVGLSRQTIYRWRKEDKNFDNSFNKAILLGIDSMGDLAHSKLIENVKKGNQRAIEFSIKKYKSSYTDLENVKPDKKIDEVKWIIVDGSEEYEIDH